MVGCKSSSKKNKNGQAFNGKWANFVKPSADKPRALQWIRILNRADFGVKNIKKHTYLCSNHFPPDVDLRWWENSSLTPAPRNYQGNENPAPVTQSASNPRKRKIPNYTGVSSPDYSKGNCFSDLATALTITLLIFSMIMELGTAKPYILQKI